MEGQCNGYFTSNWDSTMDQSDPFESALSSIVSSPVASNAGAEGDSSMIRELIGRLGSICNSGRISPSQSFLGGNSNNNSTNTTCYNTPLNSPPKLNLMGQQVTGSMPLHPGFAPIATDPGFAERAARFSCFGSSGFSGLSGNLGLNLSELPLRPSSASISSSNLVSSTKLSRMSRPSTPENAETGDSREGSSVSEQIPGSEMATKGQSDVNSRKRKAVSKTKGLANDAGAAAENDEPNEKKIKPSNVNGSEKDAGIVEEENENTKPSGDGNQKQNKDNSKPQEPPKDYIHVRARRGQATDSHSLAERVRREKISQRMKVLQDLVPGCNKVTGKAVMLDEIINYVQSLQHQVEFLSMKLATINPGMDINLEAFLSKDIFRSQGPLPNSVFVSDPSLPFTYQQGLHLHNGASNNVEAQFLIPSLNPEVQRNLNMPFSHIPGFSEASHQVSKFWEDDLQSVVQMGLVQNPEILNGSLASAQMKAEL